LATVGGYEGHCYLENLVFIHHSSGNGSATEAKATHPGFDERTRALAAFYDKLDAHPPAKTSPTPGHVT